MSFINSNWYIALIFCLVFFIGGRQLAEVPGTRPGTRRNVNLVLAAIALPALLFPIAYLPGLLAASPWYNTFRSVNRVELLSALIAPAAGYATYRKPESPYRVYKPSAAAAVFRVVKPFALPFCLLIVSLNFAGPLLMPLDKNMEFNGSWTENGVFIPSARQLSGPVAIMNMMYVLSNDAEGEYETAKGTYSDRAGTEFWYIARYAVNRGYRVKFVKPEGAADVPIPSIITVSPVSDKRDSNSQTGVDTYITLLARSAEGVITVGDPVFGRLELSISDFISRYGEPVLALVLSAPSAQ